MDEKSFLGNLYTAAENGRKKDARHYVMSATDAQLAVLVYVLHKIAVKNIAIPKKHLLRVARSRKEPLLDKFKKEENVAKILDLPRITLVSLLKSFVPLYGAFLHYLFHP